MTGAGGMEVRELRGETASETKQEKGRKRRTGGFTMIELVAVMGILSILLAVAVPQMTGYLRAAHRASAMTEAQVVADAVQQYFYDRKDAGDLGAKTVWKLMNLDINGPDNLIEDYIAGGQKGARIVSVSADIPKARLISLVYETEHCRITISIDEDGRKTLTDEMID